jgi:hypothetical protein
VPAEAKGCRSTVRRSIARLVPQPGQKTSSHGVPAVSAARIVGDHSMFASGARARPAMAYGPTAAQVHSQLVGELAHLPLDEWMQDGRLSRSTVVIVGLLGQFDPSLSKRDQVRLFRR